MPLIERNGPWKLNSAKRKKGPVNFFGKFFKTCKSIPKQQKQKTSISSQIGIDKDTLDVLKRATKALEWY